VCAIAVFAVGAGKDQTKRLCNFYALKFP